MRWHRWLSIPKLSASRQRGIRALSSLRCAWSRAKQITLLRNSSLNHGYDPAKANASGHGAVCTHAEAWDRKKVLIKGWIAPRHQRLPWICSTPTDFDKP